jgi:hypothetical protein
MGNLGCTLLCGAWPGGQRRDSASGPSAGPGSYSGDTLSIPGHCTCDTRAGAKIERRVASCGRAVGDLSLFLVLVTRDWRGQSDCEET